MVYRKIIIGPSGTGKTSYLLNSIQRESSIQRENSIIDQIYLHATDLEEQAGIRFNNDPTAFIEYSNSMDDILSDIQDYNKKRKRKYLLFLMI